MRLGFRVGTLQRPHCELLQQRTFDGGTCQRGFEYHVLTSVLVMHVGPRAALGTLLGVVLVQTILSQLDYMSNERFRLEVRQVDKGPILPSMYQMQTNSSISSGMDGMGVM